MTKLLGAIVTFVVVILAGAIGRELASGMFDSSDSSLSRAELIRVASEINKTCPIAVDSGTELMNAGAAENTLIYNYRLLHHDPNAETRAQVQALRPGVVRAACSTPSTRDRLFDNGVTMRYVYHARDRTYVAKFDVTQSDCE